MQQETQDLEADTNPDSPAAVYARRLLELQSLQARDQRFDSLYVRLKLLFGAGLVVSAIWVLKHPAAWALLPGSLVVLGILFVLHERVLKRVRYRSRLVAFQERGLARLNNTWQGQGETGERFLDPAHPYARDLDLFGKGSLFELLCTTRTRAGEEKLAEWLLASCPAEDVGPRQAAVAELNPRVALRESLSALGEGVRAGVHPQALADWGDGKANIGTKALRTVTAFLAAAWIVGLLAWGVWGLGWLAVLISLINLGLTLRIHRRVAASVAAIEEAAQDLSLLTETLGYLEGQRFTSARLVELQSAFHRSALSSVGIPASAAIHKLQKIVEYLQSNENWFVKIIDLFVFWSAHLAFAAEDWQRQYGPAIRGWLLALGELEALAALSGYAFEHPDDVFPEVVEGAAFFDAEGFAHPLIPAEHAVRNDLSLGKGLQLMIISGPNMAGKSTFMRAVGVNILLAQCGAPVRARRLRLSRMSVAASICILDSLQGGISRFYAEIRRLKLISDLTREPLPVIFLLDELLSGTNSHDRLIGTEFIVSSLVEKGAIGIVTTHDLALTKIPDSPLFVREGSPPRAVNCHFEDHIDNGELKFDFKLSPGVVQTSNALVLMRSIGLDVQAEE